MNKKTVLIIGLVSYGLMLFLSVLFYKERIGMMDAALQLFDSIRLGTFHHDRFGTSITHLFPIITSRLGLSLQIVTISYSISFVLVYATCFFLILLKFDNPALAMCLLFFNTIMVAHSFYWAQNELIQGTAVSLLYASAVEYQITRQRISKTFIILSPLAFVVIVWYYPLLPVVVVFALLYIWLHHGKKKTMFIFSVLAAYLLSICNKSTFSK